jgi:hypothetical protein
MRWLRLSARTNSVALHVILGDTEFWPQSKQLKSMGKYKNKLKKGINQDETAISDSQVR